MGRGPCGKMMESPGRRYGTHENKQFSYTTLRFYTMHETMPPFFFRRGWCCRHQRESKFSDRKVKRNLFIHRNIFSGNFGFKHRINFPSQLLNFRSIFSILNAKYLHKEVKVGKFFLIFEKFTFSYIFIITSFNVFLAAFYSQLVGGGKGRRVHA